MDTKFYAKIFLLFMIYNTQLFAEVHNQIDKNYKSKDIETGKHFYNEDKIEENKFETNANVKIKNEDKYLETLKRYYYRLNYKGKN